MELSIPRRVGAQANELGWILADLKARGAAAAASHGLELIVDRPCPGSRPDLTVQLTRDDLVALACATSGSPSPDRLDRQPADVLFLSDVVEELDAAREAGMRTVLLDRREDYPEPRTGDATNGHPRVESFAEIAP